MLIGVDFDGTIVKDSSFPSFKYTFIDNAEYTINKLHDDGHTFVLCTARYGWYILPAFWFIIKNKLPIKLHYGKPEADIYIDNKNLGCTGINWNNIYKEVKSYEEHISKS